MDPALAQYLTRKKSEEYADANLFKYLRELTA